MFVTVESLPGTLLASPPCDETIEIHEECCGLKPKSCNGGEIVLGPEIPSCLKDRHWTCKPILPKKERVNQQIEQPIGVCREGKIEFTFNFPMLDELEIEIDSLVIPKILKLPPALKTGSTRVRSSIETKESSAFSFSSSNNTDSSSSYTSSSNSSASRMSLESGEYVASPALRQELFKLPSLESKLPEQRSSSIQLKAPQLSSICAQPKTALVAFIDSCCNPVKLNGNGLSKEPKFKFTRGEPLEDPYMTGKAPDRSMTPVRSNAESLKKENLYKYVRPKTVGAGDQIRDMLLSLPKPDPRLRGTAILKQRLNQVLPTNDLAQIDRVLTYAGEGADSKVFFYHRPKPVNLSERANAAWLIDNTNEVIKIRNPSRTDTLYDVSQSIRRDISLSKLFGSFSGNFKYIDSSGKTVELIRPAPYKDNPDAFQLGILVQKAVHGKSVESLKNLVLRASKNNDPKANAYLTQQFGSVKEAERRIRAVEDFYVETHYDVIQFELENHLLVKGNYLDDNHFRPVGFDFNGGDNIIWDEKDKIFYATDY